ncbi:MAG: hypothetical protein IKA09_08190 [Lachnospiraceae bacterium]|nr:hypothetical protein [Lachnospiraceae bacterium]
MSGATDAALYPADTKNNLFQGTFKGTEVITVSGQASGVPTGTGKLVKLEGGKGIIIIFLRNRIERRRK